MKSNQEFFPARDVLRSMEESVLKRNQLSALGMKNEVNFLADYLLHLVPPREIPALLKELDCILQEKIPRETVKSKETMHRICDPYFWG